MANRSKISFDPKEFLSKVNGGRAISDYRKDQIVYRQGDPADSVFYIQSGKVKKTVHSEHGKEAVVALLGTGDFFGEGCLTGQLLRLATVSAMAECVIVRITTADSEPADLPQQLQHQRLHVISERINLFRRHASLNQPRLEKLNALHPSHTAAGGE